MQEKSNLLTLILVSVITAVVVGGAVYLWQNQGSTESNKTVINLPIVEQDQEEDQEEEVLFYSIDDSNTVVSKEKILFPFTAKQLFDRNQICGGEKTLNYFQNLLSKFKSSEIISYKFKYNGDSQEPSAYVVTLVPNKADYKRIDEFKADFDACYPGGGYYPKMLNEDWLVFESSCGSGGPGDDSAKVVGCSVVKDIVEPSLALNKYQNLFRKHLYKAHFSQWYLVFSENGIDKYEMDEELSVRIDSINGISLSIDEDGTFKMYTEEYPFFSKDRNIELGGLKGSWDLSDNGELTLSFDNGDKIEYQIKSIDKNNLLMERKSSTVEVLNSAALQLENTVSLSFPFSMAGNEDNFSFYLPADWEYFIDEYDRLIIRTIDTEELMKAKELHPGYANNIVVKYYETVEDIGITNNNDFTKPLTTLNDIFSLSAEDLSMPWQFIDNRYVDNYKAYEFISGGMGKNYGFILSNDLGVYEFQFLRATDKDALSNIETEILDSIEFKK